MKSKRYIRGACFILVLLIILGSVIWGIFTRVGENKLRLALDSAGTGKKEKGSEKGKQAEAYAVHA